MTMMMQKDPTAASLDIADPRALGGLASDATVVVALSGGADSVALLLLTPPPLLAVHIHHGIRDREADRDAAFCAELCGRLNIPYTCLYADVPRLARESGEGLESAARAARYRLLCDFAKEKNAAAILTAHHADDQLETLLMHLLRGSGLRGLCGIPARRRQDGVLLLRPMLTVTKDEILAFLAAKGQDYVTDSTNEAPNCLRNRLRLEVLPKLREISPDAAGKAAQAAAKLTEDEAYFEQAAEAFLRGQGEHPRVAALAALPKQVFVRVIRALLPMDIAAVHYDALFVLVQKATPHAALSLPHVRAVIENERLLFVKQEQPPVDYEIPLAKGECVIRTEDFCVAVGGKNAPPPSQRNLYKYATSLSFLFDKVEGKLVLRNRRAGDKLFLRGMHRSVRRLQAQATLPLSVRIRMPLLADDRGVLALPLVGMRDGADGREENDTTVWLYFN